MRLFHTTTATAADAIAASGFEDREGTYLTTVVHRGVWVADRPLDGNDYGGAGDTLLIVDMPEAEAEPYEWIEDGRGYREFLIPAALLNLYGISERLPLDDAPLEWSPHLMALRRRLGRGGRESR